MFESNAPEQEIRVVGTPIAREILKEEGQIRVSLRLGVAGIGRVEGREFRLTEKNEKSYNG